MEEYIQNTYRRKDCQAGAMVAMDPNSGAVLAIASYPTYDLTTYNLDYNALASDEAKPLLNRALNGAYAPGSTYKVGSALSALENGNVTKDKTYYWFQSKRKIYANQLSNE